MSKTKTDGLLEALRAAAPRGWVDWAIEAQPNCSSSRRGTLVEVHDDHGPWMVWVEDGAPAGEIAHLQETDSFRLDVVIP